MTNILIEATANAKALPFAPTLGIVFPLPKLIVKPLHEILTELRIL